MKLSSFQQKTGAIKSPCFYNFSQFVSIDDSEAGEVGKTADFGILFVNSNLV